VCHHSCGRVRCLSTPLISTRLLSPTCDCLSVRNGGIRGATHCSAIPWFRDQGGTPRIRFRSSRTRRRIVQLLCNHPERSVFGAPRPLPGCTGDLLHQASPRICHAGQSSCLFHVLGDRRGACCLQRRTHSQTQSRPLEAQRTRKRLMSLANLLGPSKQRSILGAAH